MVYDRVYSVLKTTEVQVSSLAFSKAESIGRGSSAQHQMLDLTWETLQATEWEENDDGLPARNMSYKLSLNYRSDAPLWACSSK